MADPDKRNGKWRCAQAQAQEWCNDAIGRMCISPTLHIIGIYKLGQPLEQVKFNLALDMH